MSAILQRYLEFKLPEVLRKRNPELYFDNGMYCPQIGDLPAGAQYITVEEVQHYGQAAIMAGAAQDVPFAEVSVGRETYDVVYIFGGAYYTDPELRSGNFAASTGQLVTNFQEERLTAMRRMIDVKSHELCAFGSSRHNIVGVLNHPEVPLSNSGTYKPYAPNATSEAIIDMITAEVQAVWTGTNFVEQPNIIGVPPTLWRVITSRFRSSNTDITIYDALLKTNPSVQRIVPIRELASSQLEANGVHSAGTNKDRIFIYNLDSTNLSRHFNPIYVMPPETDKMRYSICAYKGVSSVKFSYPKTARYVDFPISVVNN